MADSSSREYTDVTIAASGTTSGSFDCTTYQFVGFFTPAALTGTAMTFQGSNDNSTFVTVMEVGGAAAYSCTMSTSDYIPVDPRVFAGLQYVKVVSGSSEASARTIRVVKVPVTG